MILENRQIDCLQSNLTDSLISDVVGLPTTSLNNRLEEPSDAIGRRFSDCRSLGITLERNDNV